MQWLAKADSSFGPFQEIGRNILRDKNHVSGLANKPVFIGFRFWTDKYKYCRAIGRSNRRPPPKRNASIANLSEPELIKIESQALIDIADKDAKKVDAKVGG